MALVYGGRNGEHAVSRGSAASILAHLDPGRYEVTEVLIEQDGRWRVGGRLVALPEALRVMGDQDVVFPALHGAYGEDGRLQALLEFLGVPYVGNGVLAGAAGMDKIVTKKLLAADGMRVAESVTIDGHDLPPAELRRLGLPVFVKPARAGSSLGVTKVRDWDHLPAAVRVARGFDDKVLVERAIIGREIDVAVLEHPDGRVEAGPPLEITVTERTFFDYDAKYRGGAAFEIPAALDAATTELLQARAVQAFRALGCRGLLRVDFFLPAGEPGELPAGGSGEPVVNEVNTFPGMTAESQFPQIWQRAGIPFATLLDLLVAGVTRPRTIRVGG
jgi:D-alanine-D-alanine ligase